MAWAWDYLVEDHKAQNVPTIHIFAHVNSELLTDNFLPESSLYCITEINLFIIS